MEGLTPQQIADFKKQTSELESLKQKFQAVEAENASLKEQLSNTKEKASSSRIEIGTPFASIIKQLNFSDFSGGMANTKDKPIDLERGGDPQPNVNEKEKVDSGAAILFAMMQEIQKLNDRVCKIPGVPATLEEATPESFADSPFIDKISQAEIPKKFSPPIMKSYDGTTDPVEHVSLYKHRIEATSIPVNKKEVCMCKGFGSTLTGAALTWYINIPNKSVNSFADLVNLFNHQFASSRGLEKRTSDLYRIVQGPTESLRSYLARFNKEKISIPNCDKETAVEAYRQGLFVKSDLWELLTMYSCSSFDDAQAKTLAYIRLEEDPSYKVEITQRDNFDYERSGRNMIYRQAGSGYRQE